MKRNSLTGRLPAKALACCLLMSASVVLTNASPAIARSISDDSQQAAAENFVRFDLNKGLGILNDRGISDSERNAELRAFLGSLIDVRRLALFSLGLGNRSATPAQLDRYVSTFGNYAISYYETLLLKYYSGQRVQVIGCSKYDSGEYVVNVELVSPGRQRRDAGNQPVEVDFRLVDNAGRFTVSDAAVAGVWLGQQERGRINDYLLESNGNIGGVIADLSARTERLTTPATS